MEDTLVTFQTAKLARECDFKIPTLNFFNKTGDLFSLIKENILADSPKYYTFNYKDFINDWNKSEYYYSAPTQSLLQKWLREEHGIHINVTLIRESFDNEITGYYVDEIYHESGRMLYPGLDEFPSYEEALEFGLQIGLNLICDNEGETFRW